MTGPSDVICLSKIEYYMDIKTQLINLIKAADLYRSQGLLSEAIAKYENAAAVIKTAEGIKNRQHLIDNISKKIFSMQNKIKQIENQPVLPEVPKKEQDLIKALFSDSSGKSEAEAALEGAMTLA